MIASPYPVIEFRRYTIQDGERERFARRFERYFPEAIQQTGAIVAREFLLHPLDAQRGIPIFPAVDAAQEGDGTPGVVVAQIFVLQREGLEAFRNQAEEAADSLTSTGVLRGAPEFVVLDPAPRSRMRWQPEWR